ncbi:MAG: hypothetical protein JWQ40_606 [Segetibacter sp.]|nr:hypothetical protein [Segetibacter sp.]
MNKLEKAFALFDQYNQQDPHTVSWEGKDYPAEYFYALQLYNWVKKLKPTASETLLLASRSQHIGRWKVPRETYPLGKPGYYKWRTDLAKFHAETAGELMSEAGYPEDEINAVKRIIRKEQLRTDEEVQVMEDALCLVFLEFQYEDFLAKHDEEKMIRILKKSWTKMNQAGREAALTLMFNEKGTELLQRALA